MNDYELIYLIQSERDDIAYDFVFLKYEKLIWKYIHLLNVSRNEHDDLFQEGLWMLHQAIKTFNPEKNKTFTKYFDLILRRHLYKQSQKIPNYVLYEHTNFCSGVVYIEEELELPIDHSDFELQVYQAHFLSREPICEIAIRMNCPKKKIYNAIYRIREKMKT